MGGAEVVGENCSLVVFTPEDMERGEHKRELETARSEGRAMDERWHLRKDGTPILRERRAVACPRKAQASTTFTKVMQDITRAKTGRPAPTVPGRKEHAGPGDSSSGEE